jgi:hypothetical protein
LEDLIELGDGMPMGRVAGSSDSGIANGKVDSQESGAGRAFAAAEANDGLDDNPFWRTPSGTPFYVVEAHFVPKQQTIFTESREKIALWMMTTSSTFPFSHSPSRNAIRSPEAFSVSAGMSTTHFAPPRRDE